MTERTGEWRIFSPDHDDCARCRQGQFILLIEWKRHLGHAEGAHPVFEAFRTSPGNTFRFSELLLGGLIRIGSDQQVDQVVEPGIRKKGRVSCQWPLQLLAQIQDEFSGLD